MTNPAQLNSAAAAADALAFYCEEAAHGHVEGLSQVQ